MFNQKKMHIVFVIQDITTKGGTERTTVCLANMFASKGHRVDIISVFRNNPILAYAVDDSVKLSFVSESTYSLDDGKMGRCLKVIKQLPSFKRILSGIGAEIIIAQRLLAVLLVFFAGYSKRAVACEHFKYDVYNLFIRKVRAFVYRFFAWVVVLTDADKSKFLREIKHVSTIPNMVSVVPEPYKGFGTKRIISVGRLDKQKGYDLLLLALTKVLPIVQDDGWHVDIYGEGPELGILMSMSSKLSLDKFVHFKGYTSAIEKEYATSEFYVMSSRYEGFPMVLLEAAACGLPIVSFDCPEGPSVLLGNGGGILVPREDTEALAKAILNLINNDVYRQQLHQQTKDIIKPFVPEMIYERWMELLCGQLKRSYGKQK